MNNTNENIQDETEESKNLLPSTISINNMKTPIDIPTILISAKNAKEPENSLWNINGIGESYIEVK